jgi:hypothetical protein
MSFKAIQEQQDIHEQQDIQEQQVRSLNSHNCK